MLDALRLSVGTLTIVPSGAVAEIDRRTAARAMIIAPLAVVPLAAAVALLGWLGRTAGLPPLAVGLLVVGGLALGSRALHLDGLADTVDGLGSGWSAERSLMVMRRGDVGPMGVVALIVVLGLQATSIGQLIQGPPAPYWSASWSAAPGRRCLDLRTRRAGCTRGWPRNRGRRHGAASGCRGLLDHCVADHERYRLVFRARPGQRSAGYGGRRSPGRGSGLSLRTPAGWCQR